MKFVLALALVAVCVVLMHARPNIKRAAADRVKRGGEQRKHAKLVNPGQEEDNDNDGGKRNHSKKVNPKQESENEGDKEEEAEAGHQHESENEGDKEEEAEARHQHEAHGGQGYDEMEEDCDNDNDGGERKHSKKVNPKQEAVPCGEKEEEKESNHPDESDDRLKKRAATNHNTVQLWPNGNLNMKFVPETYGDKEKCKNNVCEKLKDIVKDAADEWNLMAGLNIKLDQSAKENVIEITGGQGCWSYIGHQPKDNQIVLEDDDCFHKGVTLHELGHALGFEHEAKRGDRDEYVDINEKNIQKGMQEQFRKDPNIKGIESSIPKSHEYDYCSIMHYFPTAFSNNGHETIVPDLNGDEILSCLGSQIALSLRDGIGMAALYGNLASDATGNCKNGGYMLKGDKKCRCSNLFTGTTCANPKSDPSCGTASFDLKVGSLATFKTPNFDPKNSNKKYPQDESCTWLFNSPKGSRLCIGFAAGYSLEDPAENNNLCAFDWFELATDPYLTLKTKRYCGKKNEEWGKVVGKPNSGTNWLAVVFTSDDMFPERGFQGAVYALKDGEGFEECKAMIEQNAELEGDLISVHVDDYDYYYDYDYDYYYLYY